MDEFLLNRFFIPWIITAFFFYFQISSKLLKSFLREKVKNRKKLEVFLFLVDCLKVKKGNWKRVIFLPIISAILLEIFLSLVFQTPLHGFNEPIWFAGLTSGFLAPIAEEFLTRAILLGFCGLGLLNILRLKVKLSKEKEYAYCFGWVLLASLVFVIGHENFTIFQFIVRFSNSILYGILYLANERNVLPSIIAHASSNWFIILKDFVFGFESLV